VNNLAHIKIDIPEFENFKAFETDVSPKLAYKVFKIITTPFKKELAETTKTE
jgi:hypothetical protein